MTTAILIIASVLQFSFGTLRYVRDTLAGRNKPNRMTFLIWAAGPFIALAAGKISGGGWALLPVFIGGFGPFLFFLASFYNPAAYWKLGRLDYWCGRLAILALVLWIITKDPSIAVTFAILADALAAIPLLIQCWRHPETQTGFTFIIATLNAGLGLFLSIGLPFSQIAFLVYLVVCDVAVVFAIYHKRILQFLDLAAIFP